MTYCVIATDPATGNEWVMPKTVDTITEASEMVKKYMEEDDRFSYRIEFITPASEHNLKVLRQGMEWEVGDREPSRPFTALELFPPRNKMTTSDCLECGATVRIPHQNLHAKWHNKVADL